MPRSIRSMMSRFMASGSSVEAGWFFERVVLSSAAADGLEELWKLVMISCGDLIVKVMIPLGSSLCWLKKVVEERGEGVGSSRGDEGNWWNWLRRACSVSRSCRSK